MKKESIKGEKSFGNKFISVNLQVFLFLEDDVYFAYMPSFDLTGYGNTEHEARESLTIVLDEFLRYTLNKNTLFLELKRLGWKKNSKGREMFAPQVSDLIRRNEQLKEIVNSKQFSSSSYPVSVPAFA